MDKANLLTALIAGDLDYYTFGGSISEENRPVAEQAGFAVGEGTIDIRIGELMINNETVDSADPAPRHREGPGQGTAVPAEHRFPGYGDQHQHPCRARSTPRPAGESTYDPEGAKELLAQAGYDGETFTLACTSQRASLAALIQQNLADVGIQVEIETVDSATMFAGMSDGTYDLAVASHTPTSLPLWFTGSRFTVDNNLFRGARPEPVHHPAHRLGGGDQQDRPHRPGGRVGSPLESGDALYPPVVLLCPACAVQDGHRH